MGADVKRVEQVKKVSVHVGRIGPCVFSGTTRTALELQTPAL